MPNHAHALALLPIEPEPPSTPILAEATAPTEIEALIGKTVAQAALLVCQALEAYQAGRSTLAITGQGSELIAKLYELRQSAPDLDFEAVARREGKRVLRQTLARNPDAAVFSADQIEASLTEIVSWPLGALAHITQIERALAN